jgi:hypothetical protein
MIGGELNNAADIRNLSIDAAPIALPLWVDLIWTGTNTFYFQFSPTGIDGSFGDWGNGAETQGVSGDWPPTHYGFCAKSHTATVETQDAVGPLRIYEANKYDL